MYAADLYRQLSTITAKTSKSVKVAKSASSKSKQDNQCWFSVLALTRTLPKPLICEIASCLGPVKNTQIGIFWPVYKKLPKRARDRLEEIEPYFHSRIHQFIPYIDENSKLSLRGLDWLVTNYSKAEDICIKNHQGQNINIHGNYQSWLAYWHRRLFDPFRRRQRIFFQYDGVTYATTVAQLNFLYWAFVKTTVFEYYQEYYHAIKKHMTKHNNVNKEDKKKYAQKGIKRKRKELTKAPNLVCVAYDTPQTIKFK